jgi:hypothetical protein
LFNKNYLDLDSQTASYRIVRMYREGGRFQPLQEELLEFLLEKSKKNFIATLSLSMLSFEEVGNLGEFEKFVESLDHFLDKRMSKQQNKSVCVAMAKQFLVNLENLLDMETEVPDGNRLDCLELLGFFVQDFPRRDRRGL